MDMQRQTRTYQVIADENEHTIDVTISQPFSGTILGLSTWSSALFLANRIHLLGEDIQPPPANGSTSLTNGAIDHLANGYTNGLTNGHLMRSDEKRRVLEIGAGTGLAGLSTALLWHADVVLTDIPECTENLAKTISFNAAALAETNSTVRAGALHWSDARQLKLHNEKPKGPDQLGQFDVILAADTVYDEEHPELIVRVINTWLKRNAGARVIMGYPLRVMHLDFIRELWKKLDKIGLVAVQEGKVDVGEEWDDERLCEWAVWMWRDADRSSAG